MTWRMTVWEGRITEACSEMVKDKSDDVGVYYWTETKPCLEVGDAVLYYWTETKPCPEVLSLFFVFSSLVSAFLVFIKKNSPFLIKHFNYRVKQNVLILPFYVISFLFVE